MPLELLKPQFVLLILISPISLHYSALEYVCTHLFMNLCLRCSLCTCSALFDGDDLTNEEEKECDETNVIG